MKFSIAVCLCVTLILTGCAGTLAPQPESVGQEPESFKPAVARDAVRPASPTPKRGNAPDSAPSAADRTLSPASSQWTSSRPVVSMETPADLWDRIRRGFAMPDLQSDLVRDREQWYTTRPDYIFRMTERSRKYLFHIVEELEMRNMPTELALLPFVESAFNPQAVSSAKAAGMWQFMPATGRSFELKQNVFRDDRRDVLASTRAALDYLQKLYGMFGDWHLALAAYNWGEGSVGRSIAKNQKVGAGTTYVDLNMPMETRMYVPKLQAIKNIVAAPAAFNSKLPPIGNHPYFQTVEIKRDIDVTLAAKLAEVTLEDFKALNPSVNKPVILAAGTPQILLPWDNATIFENNLQSYGATRLASWTVWVAPTGMRVADAANKAGMSEADFRKVNNIPPRMLIRAGSALLIPRSNQAAADVASHVADNGQVSFAPEVVLRRRTVKAGRKDTVASIARKYQVTAANVALWNKVSTTASFKAGQSVILFQAPSAAAPKVRSSRSAAATKPPIKKAPAKKAPAKKTVKVAKN